MYDKGAAETMMTIAFSTKVAVANAIYNIHDNKLHFAKITTSEMCVENS